MVGLFALIRTGSSQIRLSIMAKPLDFGHSSSFRDAQRAESFRTRNGFGPRMRSRNDEGAYRANSFSGSFALSFSRSSTIDERTCATLWCGISTLLTMSDRLLRSRSTAFSR